MGAFSWPSDSARLGALALALLAPLIVPRLLRPSRRSAGDVIFGLGAALGAAALSAGYVQSILRGGPRIIDATSYWLEARALDAGWLAWPLGEPEQAVVGRFLLRTAAPVGLGEALGLGSAGQAIGPGVAVIFPPGYPALLALGMRLGAPLAVGPVLGAALVLATIALARAVCRSARAHGLPLGAAGPAAEQAIVRIAALFSMLCAALRYHTADTMSHGLAALCWTTALAALLSAALPGTGTERRAWLVALAGLATGWLAATRPASAVALGLCLGAMVVGLVRRSSPVAVATPHLEARRSRLAASALWALPVAAFALALLPGLALYAAHQRAATGSIFGSAQLAYYALSDGPADCFRYGFGSGTGCLGEHGPFVSANLPNGYGLLEAASTTLRRLQMHLGDPFDFAPLFLLVPLGAWLGRRVTAVRLLALGVLLQMACYAPFYFDGNYPGGGARMFADVLPLEHVLGAIALALLGARAPRGRPSLSWLAGATVMLEALGFAFQNGADHAQLRGRDAGRPLFEPAELERARVERGLVLVGTDAGFDLGHRPGSLSEPNAGGSRPLGEAEIVVARRKGDDLDRLVWESLGRPSVFRYDYDVEDGAAPRQREAALLPGPRPVDISPIFFDPRPTAELSLRIEGESLWPPHAQHGAWAWPEHTNLGCVSRGQWLAVHPPQPKDKGGPPPSVTLALPARTLAARKLWLKLGWLGHEQSPAPAAEPYGAPCDEEGPLRGRALVVLRSNGRELHKWQVPVCSQARCIELERAEVPNDLDTLELEIGTSAEIGLDLVAAEPVATAAASLR